MWHTCGISENEVKQSVDKATLESSIEKENALRVGCVITTVFVPN